MGKMMTKLFAKPLFDSKIKSANTEGKEKVWGYFVGPMFMCMAYYGIAGTYLTQFYTDVLGLSGVVLTMMPVFSKIFDAITNIIMGRIIDKTKTRQGKARPWILISGVLIMLTGIMLYNVPRASQSVQLVWIVISYNLFFAFAYTIYNMSHTLMVPLATRNTRQRDSLAMLNIYDSGNAGYYHYADSGCQDGRWTVCTGQLGKSYEYYFYLCPSCGIGGILLYKGTCNRRKHQR